MIRNIVFTHSAALCIGSLLDFTIAYYRIAAMKIELVILKLGQKTIETWPIIVFVFLFMASVI